MRACVQRVSWGWAAALAMALGCSGPSSNEPSLPISVSLTSSAQAVDQSLSTDALAIVIKATVTNDTSSKGVTWSLNGPGSIGISPNMSVTYTSPFTLVASAELATVTATSVADPTKSASVQITVNPDPFIPFNQVLPIGTVGVPYSLPVVLDGGTAPLRWAVYNGPIETGFAVGGAVPDGLTLNAATGTLSGVPTSAGTWYFEATMTDDDGQFAYNVITVQINPAAAAAANAVPFLNQTLTPTSVAPGGGALTLKVSGAGFVSGATIDFNGTPLTTTFVDSDHLSAVVPAADIVTAQTAAVTVVNPAPGGGSSNVVYLPVGAAESAVSFVNAPNSPLQVQALGLAVADFNQDGKPDLAVAANIRLSTMLGNGDGTFAAAPLSPDPILSPPYADYATPAIGPGMAVGDFNRSGHAGLAIVESENEAAAILLGNGNGTFAASSAAFANSQYPPIAVEAADFNGDGNLDLTIVNSIGYPSLVTLGYGKGAFTSAGQLYSQGMAVGGVVGDFNVDGMLDVVIAGGGSTAYPGSGLAVSLGKGDGTFTQANGSPMVLGQSLSAIVAGDFNGDGKLDIAVTDMSGNEVYVLLGKGDGTFQAAKTFTVGSQPWSIVTGDFNNDGKLDLAVANYGDGTVTLLLGNGDGTFAQASGSPYTVGKSPSAIVAADFNGDGKLDLAVANSLGGTDGTVSILLQP